MKKLMSFGLLFIGAGVGAAIVENITGAGIQRPTLLPAGPFATGGIFVGAIIVLWVAYVDILGRLRNPEQK